MNNAINRILTFKEVVIDDTYTEVLYDTNFYSECVVCDIMASITAVVNDDDNSTDIVGVTLVIDGNYVSHGKMGFDGSEFPQNTVTVTIPHLLELSAGNHDVVLSVKMYNGTESVLINPSDLKSTSLEENRGIAIISITTYPSDNVDYTNLIYLSPNPEITLKELYQNVLSKTYDITEPTIIKITGSTTFYSLDDSISPTSVNSQDSVYSPYEVRLKLNNDILAFGKLKIDNVEIKPSAGTTTITWVGLVNVGRYNIVLEAKRWNNEKGGGIITLSPGLSVHDVSEDSGKGIAFLNVLLIPEQTSGTNFSDKSLLGGDNARRLTTTYKEMLSDAFYSDTDSFFDLVASVTFVVINLNNVGPLLVVIGLILMIDGEVVSHAKSSCSNDDSTETNITISFAGSIDKGHHTAKLLAVVYNQDGQQDNAMVIVNPLGTVEQTSNSIFNGIARITIIFSEARHKNICGCC